MWLLFLFIVIVLISLMVNGFMPTLIVVLIGFVIGDVIGYSRYKNQKPDLLANKKDEDISNEDLGYCNRSFNKWR